MRKFATKKPWVTGAALSPTNVWGICRLQQFLMGPFIIFWSHCCPANPRDTSVEAWPAMTSSCYWTLTQLGPLYWQIVFSVPALDVGNSCENEIYPELVLLKNSICVSLTPVFNVSDHLILLYSFCILSQLSAVRGIISHPSGEGGNKSVLAVFAGEKKLTSLC